MSDESSEKRVKRIAREVVDELAIGRIACVEAIDRERWRLMIISHSEQVVTIQFDLLASDDVMKRDLMKVVRAAIGH